MAYNIFIIIILINHQLKYLVKSSNYLYNILMSLNQ